MVPQQPILQQDVNLETDTITRISTAGFTWSSNFDYLAPAKPVISCYRISHLNARQLRFFKTTAGRKTVRKRLITDLK